MVNNFERAQRHMCGSRIPDGDEYALRTQHRDWIQPEPPCSEDECSECFHQWRAKEGQIFLSEVYVNILSDEDASRLLTAFITSIDRDQDWLKQALETTGDTVITRWRRGPRLEYLNNACLKMFSKSFPIQQISCNLACDRAENKWSFIRHKYSEAILLPFLNSETLSSDPDLLLNLLYHRSRNDYRQFAMLDLGQQRIGFHSDFLPVDYNPNCVDLSTSSEYGKLHPFQSHLAHQWTIVGFPRAKLVLGAQVRLYRSLRQIVQALTNDNTNIKIASGAWRDFCETREISANLIQSPSFYTKRMFHGPPLLNLSYFCKVAKNRKALAQDHLWLLQTDLGYLHASVAQLMSSEAYRKSSPTVAARFATDTIFDESLNNYRAWSDIEEECHHAQKVASRFTSALNPYHRLPREYDVALCLLELMLRNGFTQYKKILQNLYVASEGLERNHITWTDSNGFSCTRFKERAGKGSQGDIYFRKDPLFWCIKEMLDDDRDPSNYDFRELSDFLNCHMAPSNAKERARVDQRMFDHLSGMAAVHELLSELQMVRPRHNEGRKGLLHAAAKQTDRRACRMLRTKPTRFTVEEKDGLGTSLMNFYKVQLPASRTSKAYYERTIAARKKMMDFWSDARDLLHVRCKRNQYFEVDMDTELRSVSLWESEEHLKQARFEEEQLAAFQQQSGTGRGSGSKQTTHPSAPLQTEWGNSAGDVSSAPGATSEPKHKTKTRPAQEDESSSSLKSEEASLTTQEKDSPMIAVKGVSLTLFRRMFRVPNSSYPATGKIRWPAFVSALDNAGLSITEGQGSVVNFEHGAGSRGGCVVIHKPHPDNEVSDIMLRSIGKRLHKWFGWTRETFVEAEKSG